MKMGDVRVASDLNLAAMLPVALRRERIASRTPFSFVKPMQNCKSVLYLKAKMTGGEGEMYVVCMLVFGRGREWRA